MSDHFSSISIDPDTKAQSPKVSKPHKKREPAGKKTIRKLPPLNPYLVAALVAVLLFGIYCIAGFLVVPELITGKLRQYFQKHTGMELKIGETQFNPFTFRAHFADITLSNDTESKKEPVFLKAADLRIDLKPLLLLRDNLVCESLQVSGLSVTVIRYSDKKYNVSQFFSASEPAEELIEFSKLPFLFSFNNISINNSAVIFDDRISGKVHKAEKIELTLPALSNFSYKTKTFVSPRFSAVINGSPVQLTGEAAVPGEKGGEQTRLSFDLHSLDLPLYFGYLPYSLPVQLAKGTADGQIQVSFIPDKDHAKRLTILFQMDTKDVELQNQDKSFTVIMPTARLEGDLQPFTGDLHLQNILFHEPVVRLNENFSELTLDNLLPAADRPSSQKIPEQASPLLAIDLFIMDNGILHIIEGQGKKNNERTYQSLQLNIKNYTNRPKETHDTSGTGCAFKLSGEQLSPSASFSWQGDLDEKNTPKGTLHLNHFPASLLNTIFTEENNEITGTADVTGNLSVQRKSGEKKRFSYSLSDGSIKITDLGLSEKKHEWLHAALLTMGPVDSKNNSLDIGNILLQNATITLHQNHSPRLLDSLSQKGSVYKIHGIDFSGNIILKSAENTKTPLVFNDLSLQANSLERDTKDKENFALTGKTGRTGVIKAKGSVALGPFRASLAVEFSGMQSRELLPWYTDAPFLLDGQAHMEGTGHLTYPDTAFKGSLRITEARFENRQAKSILAWNEAHFQDFAFTKRPFHLSISAAQIDRPVLTYLQADEKSSIFEQTASFIKGMLPKKDQENKAKTSSAPDLHIKDITVKNGSIVYKDIRLAPPWQQEISALQGQIGNVSVPFTGASTSYSFSGTLVGHPMTIDGTTDLFASPLIAQLNVKMAAVPVSLYKEQLSPLLDLDTSRGTFDLTLQDNLKDGQENGEIRLLFHSLSPASPSSDTALPLALLSDSHDNFALNVPLADPENKQHAPVFATAVKFFKRIVVKSVVAPLLLTNDNFSKLAFDDTPDFMDGESVLSEKGKAKLTLYRDLLVAHPRLKLIITGMADTDLDKKVLLEKLQRAENKRVEEENLKRSQEWQKLHNQKQQQPGQHKNTITEKDIPAEELAHYTPVFPKPVFVSDQAMSELAEQRTIRAYEFFTAQLGLGPDRIMKHVNKPEQVGESMNRVHVTLQTLAAPRKPAPSSEQDPE